jgi:hypothetical protein
MPITIADKDVRTTRSGVKYLNHTNNAGKTKKVHIRRNTRLYTHYETNIKKDANIRVTLTKPTKKQMKQNLYNDDYGELTSGLFNVGNTVVVVTRLMADHKWYNPGSIRYRCLMGVYKSMDMAMKMTTETKDHCGEDKEYITSAQYNTITIT